MAETKRDTLRSVRQRRFLNKEFDAFRQDLLEDARSFIVDFSESSIGGLFMDMPAYVGDVLSFYLDHQFSELDVDTAVENENIERALRRVGVEVTGAAPAVVTVAFYVEVPAAVESGFVRPQTSALPIVEAGTILRAENGVEFELVRDVDFTEVDVDGNLKAVYRVGTSVANVPKTFVLQREGLCVSGFTATDTYTFSGFVPFRRVTLSNVNVTRIVNVVDSLGNVYYRVGNLTEDVIYKMIPNTGYDRQQVDNALSLLPVPYRFTTAVSLFERATTLIFGGGSADTLEDDAVPDPSIFALPLYGKTTFSRTTLNPQKLLDTKTLGISATDVTVDVTYRYGGGASHNVEKDTLRYVSILSMKFPNGPSALVSAAVRASVSVSNKKKALGGADPPTIDELKEQVPLARSAQSRIVTKPDVVARAYTLPNDLGRPFRVATRSSPDNPFAALLYVVCRDGDGFLTAATDTLKDNLRVHLNGYRMVSDAIDILDARVVNYRILYEVTVDPTMNKKLTLQQINVKLRRFVDVKFFHIDQPILLSDIQNLIYNTIGVISVSDIKLTNVSGDTEGNEYSAVAYDLQAYTRRNAIVPPPGGIFECKYPEMDIQGRAV